MTPLRHKAGDLDRRSPSDPGISLATYRTFGTVLLWLFP